MSTTPSIHVVNVKVQKFYVTCPRCSNIISSIQGDPRGLKLQCDKCSSDLEISNDVEFE